MREAQMGDHTVLVLREPKPVPNPHRCPVSVGDSAPEADNGAIIQCECGKRYQCRESQSLAHDYVWVRRLLPWPPRQSWPKES